MDSWDAGDHDADAELAAALARSRERRRRMATVMVAVLVIPIGVQLVLVSSGLAVNYGLMAVALPATVGWILWRGRGARPDDGGGDLSR